MKAFICVLALVSVANATFLSGLGDGGSNGGGHHGPPPPAHVHHHSKHVVNVFHHSAPAPVVYGGGGHGHEHVVKVIHEDGGLSHGGADLQVIKVINEGAALHHAPLGHHEHAVKLIKVINEEPHFVHHAPLVHHAPAAHVEVLKVLHGHEHSHPLPLSNGW